MAELLSTRPDVRPEAVHFFMDETQTWGKHFQGSSHILVEQTLSVLQSTPKSGLGVTETPGLEVGPSTSVKEIQLHCGGISLVDT
jgi:hypothetical protein